MESLRHYRKIIDRPPPAAGRLLNAWKFSCERDPIMVSLPPKIFTHTTCDDTVRYILARMLSDLDAENNSYCFLESPTRSYIQCGGSRTRCTVEMRIYLGNSYIHSAPKCRHAFP